MFWKRLFASKNVRSVLEILGNIKEEHDNEAGKTICEMTERLVLTQAKLLEQAIQGGISPEQAAYSKVANIAGDLLESGKLHLHRGVLDPLGMGNDALSLFDATVEKMHNVGIIDAAYCEKQKTDLRHRISEIG